MKRQRKFSWDPGSKGGKIKPYSEEELLSSIQGLEKVLKQDLNLVLRQQFEKTLGILLDKLHRLGIQNGDTNADSPKVSGPIGGEARLSPLS